MGQYSPQCRRVYYVLTKNIHPKCVNDADTVFFPLTSTANYPAICKGRMLLFSLLSFMWNQFFFTHQRRKGVKKTPFKKVLFATFAILKGI